MSAQSRPRVGVNVSELHASGERIVGKAILLDLWLEAQRLHEAAA